MNKLRGQASELRCRPTSDRRGRSEPRQAEIQCRIQCRVRRLRRIKNYEALPLLQQALHQYVEKGKKSAA